MEYNIHLYGWDYVLWTDDAGKITHIQCNYRWAKAEIKYLGDDWLLGELQSKVDELRNP